MTTPLRFGYAGKLTPNYGAAQQAAYLVKTSPTLVGVEVVPVPNSRQPAYRVATHNEYWQAMLGNRIVWTA